LSKRGSSSTTKTLISNSAAGVLRPGGTAGQEFHKHYATKHIKIALRKNSRALMLP
jgi:hypothetical protein